MSLLTPQEKSHLLGGRITTSFGYDNGGCTGGMCCDDGWSIPKSCNESNCDGCGGTGGGTGGGINYNC